MNFIFHINLSIVFLIFTNCYIIKAQVKLSDRPVVIVVSFDGVRYDYMSLTETPYLDELKTKGVSVAYMRSQFMTKTFPNHQSIATGFFTETHGISDNNFFDPIYNRSVDAFTPEFWNYDQTIVPVWTLNEWDGGVSATMMWPGSNHPYGSNETLPFHYQRWNGSWTFEQRVDVLLEWVIHPISPANILFMYLEEPDGYGHAFGPNSPEIVQQIQLVDKRVGYLTDKLKNFGIFEQVNLILVSDHGFVEIKQSNIMNVSQLVDSSLYSRTGGSPVWHIYPTEGNLETVYEGFKIGSGNLNYKVYKTKEIPEEWHFKKNRRVGPLVLISDLGYVFDDFYGAIEEHNADFNLTASPDRVYGHHGFDRNSEAMRAFFLAHGPAFKKGVTIEPFDNVDVVPLICNLTKLPLHLTNGSLNSFASALTGNSNSSGVLHALKIYFLVLLTFFVITNNY